MSFLNYLRPSSNTSPKGSQEGNLMDTAASSDELAAGSSSAHVPSAAAGESSAGAAAEALGTVNEEENLAKLAHDLQQEVRDRTADVAALRSEVSSQHTVLSHMAEKMVGASGADVSQQDELTAVQQQMELQAGALREGLMDIQQQRAEMQQQRTALLALAKKIDQVGLGGEAGAAAGAADAAIAELRKEVAEVRDAVSSFRGSFASQVEELRREVRRGRPSFGSDQVSPTREELAALGRGLSEGSEGGLSLGGVGLTSRKELAEEIANVVHETDRRCSDVSEALERDRSQRLLEVEEIRQRLESSAELAQERAVESTLQQLRLELREETVKLGQELAASGAQRTDQFERKLLAMHEKLEETVVSRSEFVQLSEEVREVRGEAASRLAEGSDADAGRFGNQLEGLAASLGELDARQGAAEARFAAELGHLAAAVDLVRGSSQAGPAAASLGAVLGKDAQAGGFDLQRVAAELEALRAKSDCLDRSLKLEIERVVSQDVVGLREDLALIRQQMEAAEAREMTMQAEVSVCLQLGQDAAARLPALTAQVERMEANLQAATSIDATSARIAPPVQQPVQQAQPSAQPPSKQQPLLAQSKKLSDATGPTPPARQVLLTSTASSLSFTAKAGPVTVSPSVHLPLVQASSGSFPAGHPSAVPQLKPGLGARQETVGLLQSSSTPRGNPHSVPAVLHGLTEAARALQPGAARRKALVIACSYFSSQAPLHGTLNDAWNVQCLLRHTLQYAEDQVRFLIDRSEFCKVGAAAKGPTQANILEGLEWLTADAQPGDDLFFYYGGYGTQQPTGQTGDLCEAHLVPSDFAEGLPSASGTPAAGASASVASDASGYGAAGTNYRLVPLADVSRAIASLPAACKVTMVLDCCFSLVPGIGPSGNAQPAAFPRVPMKPPPPIQAADGGSQPLTPRPRYLELPSPPAGPGGRAAGSGPGGAPEPSCLVHCFSACQQPQWCVEIPLEGVVQGAFTWAWVKALISVHLEAQVTQLCSALRGIFAELKEHFLWLDQTPVVQLSASAKLREGQREEAALSKPLKMPVVALPSNHRRRKALLVGVNYAESQVAPVQLKGCVNDAWNVHSVLRKTLQFTDDQVRILVDEEHGAPLQASRAPTRANLLAGLQWLVSGAQPGDCLLFLFCGYGTQHPSTPGSAEHEAYLVPSDFAADVPEEHFAQLHQDRSAPTTPAPSHQPSPMPTSAPAGGAVGKGYRLVSMLEVNRLVGQLPARSCLTMVLDCAYPSALGLNPPQSPVFSRVFRKRVDHRKLRDYVTRPRFLELPALPVQLTPEHLRAPVSPECVVHCFSACKLEEWSCELPLEGTVQGTFTWAFTKALAAGHYRCSVSKLQEALLRITLDLKLRFSGVAQTPVLLLSRAASGNNQVFCP